MLPNSLDNSRFAVGGESWDCIGCLVKRGDMQNGQTSHLITSQNARIYSVACAIYLEIC